MKAPSETKSTALWRALLFAACLLAIPMIVASRAGAQNVAVEGCPQRPAAGSEVGEPEELRSRNGVLRVDFTYRNAVGENGRMDYCYLYKDGSEAPTLRLKAGDLLVLRLKNEVELPSSSISSSSGSAEKASHAHSMAGACTATRMTLGSTNIHFHGLSVPPVCHQDDVLHTMIQPGDPAYEYRFRIPENEPPGLYWYHPHVHGLTTPQVQGGASGALIIDGIERTNRALAGLPQRVFIIRDEKLLNPNANPVQTDSVPPPIILRDAEGDAMNTGTGGGKPAEDLSINFVPVPYPTYPPAAVKTRPGERQFWYVLNACAITYLDLQMLIDNKNTPQMMGVVSLDGVPINEDRLAGKRILWESHIQVPPAGRVGIIVDGPPAGARWSFVTRTVDTGPAGENDPTRPLATIAADPAAPEPIARLDVSRAALPPRSTAWLGNTKPVRTRRLYFSEEPHDPKDPNSKTDFYMTVQGQKPKLFDPNDMTPNIVARQGDVEDWIIENRTTELHAFHIHQIHFVLVEWNGVPLDEPFLRDTINVGYWDGVSKQYPSVKLRMDFRDPNSVGTFVYHCHLLEHEDGGMMGVVRVLPKGRETSLMGTAERPGRLLCGLRKRKTVPDAGHRPQAAMNAKIVNITEPLN